MHTRRPANGWFGRVDTGNAFGFGQQSVCATTEYTCCDDLTRGRLHESFISYLLEPQCGHRAIYALRCACAASLQPRAVRRGVIGRQRPCHARLRSITACYISRWSFKVCLPCSYEYGLIRFAHIGSASESLIMMNAFQSAMQGGSQNAAAFSNVRTVRTSAPPAALTSGGSADSSRSQLLFSNAVALLQWCAARQCARLCP